MSNTPTHVSTSGFKFSYVHLTIVFILCNFQRFFPAIRPSCIIHKDVYFTELSHGLVHSVFPDCCARHIRLDEDCRMACLSDIGGHTVKYSLMKIETSYMLVRSLHTEHRLR